jgi:hypothetical protein
MLTASKKIGTTWTWERSPTPPAYNRGPPLQYISLNHYW